MGALGQYTDLNEDNLLCIYSFDSTYTGGVFLGKFNVSTGVISEIATI